MSPHKAPRRGSKGYESLLKIACLEGLKSQKGQAIITAGNREKNVLIINAPLSLKKRLFFSLRLGESRRGKRGCAEVVGMW